MKILTILFLAAFTAAISAVAQVDVVPAPQQPAPTVAEVTPLPGEHVIEIELAVSRGSVQAYFGRAPRKEAIDLGPAKLTFKAPSSMTVTKLVSRDDDSPGAKKVTPDNPWIVRAPFSGPGRYVFNISDWSDDPVVTAALVKMDGAVLFSGRGSEDNFNGWAVKTYASGVNKTGDREIAFVVP